MNQNKYIPYGKQKITEDDINAVIKTLKSDFLTQGEQVPLFENDLCRFLGVDHSIAVNSGTSALHIACLSLNLQEKDYLWTSSTSFVASANCGRYCNAKIDFVDINLDDGLISIDLLTKKLKEAEKKGTLPKVLVCVHLGGTSCDMKSIKNLSMKYGFKVIEDASHALGGRYSDRNIGDCFYSDICVFSFHPVKIITTAEGGVATTNNKALAERMRLLRTHCITKDISKFQLSKFGPWSYEQQSLGFNYRMNDIQASLGSSQLKRILDIVDERNNILKKYKKIADNEVISFLKISKDTKSSVHLVIVLLKNLSEDNHKKVFDEMRKRSIGVQLHYSPIHLQPYYRKFGFKEGDFPMSEIYAKKALSLPVFEGLEMKDQEYVMNNLLDIIYNL
ncbi:UDP-4-amino-4,6-dideoxy-N-acetyl-beta-L-altrosamine transaminase [Prochlorococcus sp. MIT 0604]|uniref:UDP-4-amino-4, 6-dideoxy-N-acetyl-beta-L-altrosamine transaminase n=1 Tax=Prochlorococcus sp. MIT 0604 TaxID=1501268 RepID=UPI0004F8705D|nr:UDP-4-amino-4,6-dideoxy-N-acetyl-beta-L-altrosamine transaminase [Prochlorococcus sp. MIT 0604]AIQ95508.1 Bacillosamine/Legionaminic acid biosynthesis aminotransferase PglE [Prochlorococcus sp. MIT 0604]